MSNAELAVKIGILSAKLQCEITEIISVMHECEKGSLARWCVQQAGWSVMDAYQKLRNAGDELMLREEVYNA